MRTISKIPDHIDQEWAAAQYDSCLYPISSTVLGQVEDNLLPGTCAVLFSGGRRLNFDAVYIEPKQYNKIELDWQPRTIFVDPSKEDLLLYIIYKLKITNLLILNTNIFIRYRPWQKIADDVARFKTVAERVIVTIPQDRIDFNRLKHDLDWVSLSLHGRVVDGTIMICR